MRIGKNLIRQRFAKGWSQEDVAREVGMSQSNYSKIESDKQDASPEQIEAFAAALGVSPATLIGPDNPFYSIENQHGGNATNYLVQGGMEAVVAAKDETIAVLKAQLHGLEARIQSMEEEIRINREQVEMLLTRALK